jgi:hypothetical protein
MKCSARILTLIGIIPLLITALPAMAISQSGPNSSLSQSNPLTIWQARRTVAAALSARAYVLIADPGSFRFSPDSFEFDATYLKKTEHFKINLRTLEPVYSMMLSSTCSRTLN